MPVIRANNPRLGADILDTVLTAKRLAEVWRRPDHETGHYQLVTREELLPFGSVTFDDDPNPSEDAIVVFDHNGVEMHVAATSWVFGLIRDYHRAREGDTVGPFPASHLSSDQIIEDLKATLRREWAMELRRNNPGPDGMDAWRMIMLSAI